MAMTLQAHFKVPEVVLSVKGSTKSAYITLLLTPHCPNGVGQAPEVMLCESFSRTYHLLSYPGALHGCLAQIDLCEFT